MTEEKKIRKSIISKSISRKVQTDKYENLTISAHFEEEVEWKDLKERQQKSDNITKLLVNDFKQTVVIVLGGLGLTEVKAFADQPDIFKSPKNSIKDLGLDSINE